MTLQLDKTDPETGRKVEEYLKLMRVASPTVARRSVLDPVTEAARLEKIEDSFHTIMMVLGLDTHDESLRETPARVAKMFLKELFWGLEPDNFPKITVVSNDMNYDSMIVEKDITLMSSCEHHFVTIDGRCTVAYIPRAKVLGLSKMNRIVEYFSRRPQLQERITEQVWHTLSYLLGTEDVAVYIDAVHYCVRSRGVEDPNSRTQTNKLGGAFKINATTRAEFMAIAR